MEEPITAASNEILTGPPGRPVRIINMAASKVFEEDEVFVVDKKMGFRCGLVVENAEYVSSDEDEEDIPMFERVKKGTVLVAWHPSGEEEVVPEKNVHLADRSLMPGDVVRRLIEGQESQRGFVCDTSVTCHVQLLGQNCVICDINSCSLKPILYFDTDPGDVYLNSWIGKIEQVVDQVTLVFPDGARCRMDDQMQLYNFEDINDKRDPETIFCNVTYYPGQQLRCCLCDFESATWLKVTKAHSAETCGKTRRKKHSTDKEVVVTVEEVKPRSINVHWMCRGFSQVTELPDKIGPPPKAVTGDDIKKLRKLHCFESCSVQIGDKGFYTLTESDSVQCMPTRAKRSALYYIMKQLHNGGAMNANNKLNEHGSYSNTNKPAPTNCHDSVPMDSVSNSGTSSDVVENTQAAGGDDINRNCAIAVSKYLQEELARASCDSEGGDDNDTDSDSSASAKSNSSLPMTTGGKGRKRSGKKKVAVATAAPPTGQGKSQKRKRQKQQQAKKMCGALPRAMRQELRPGDQVAVEVLYTFSRVTVMWQDGTLEKDVPSTDLFPVHHLDELEFFPGDFVVPADGEDKTHTYGVVERMDHFGRTCMVHWMRPYNEGQGDRPTESTVAEEVSVYDIKDHPDYKFRPGQVVVRVGGFKGADDQGVAAGQVRELGCDGHMLIEWVDGTRSQCYPQELFLMGDELSELDSSSESDFESFDGSADESDASWETEEEVEMSNSENGENEDNNSTCQGSDEAHRLLQTNQQLDAVRMSLIKICQVLSPSTPQLNSIPVYREILHAYRECRELDSLLSSSYFNTPMLLDLIAAIRGDLKREKTAKLGRKVLEKYQLNTRQQHQGEAGRLPTEVQISENGDTAIIDEGATVAMATTGEATGKDVIDKGDCGEICALDGKDNIPMDMLHNGTTADRGVGDAAQTTPLKDTNDMAGKSSDDTGVSLDDAVASSDDSAVSLTLSKKAHELCCLVCQILTKQIEAAMAELKKREAHTPDTVKDTGSTGTLVAGVVHHISPITDSNVLAPPEMLSIHEAQPAFVPSPDNDPCSVEQTSSEKPMQKLQLPLADANQSSSLDAVAMTTPETPQTPAEIRSKLECNLRGFTLEETAPDSQKYKYFDQQPTDRKSFFAAVRKEMKLLRTSLPKGIFVKGYEDRMDLFSVMIVGPAKTPYEDGLFFFDVHLPNEYPNMPPDFHYISYCNDRLNPNLYEDGKVCVSLLGTWAGKGTEMWTSKSSLLQVLISIQGLILVGEPYYNEAGYEKQKGSQHAHENSRMYNEMAILKMMQSMSCMLQSPPAVFEGELMEHMRLCVPRMIRRLEHWMQISEQESMSDQQDSNIASTDPVSPSTLGQKPEFPLLPVSKGFRLTLRKKLEEFQSLLKAMGACSNSPKNT